MANKINKLWGGRFNNETASELEQFTSSVHFDQHLAVYDIRGSHAHARTLEKAGVINTKEMQQIIQGLEQIQKEVAEGKLEWSATLEDVHTNIETRLVALIGDAGKKLHTGRSRNDQVATDVRLYLRDATSEIKELIIALQEAIVDVAEREIETVMPGYTHLQAAQPISFGHHLLAWFEMLKRDYSRIEDTTERADVMPLGSAALAGTSFALDREYTAKLLGFKRISNNSMDAVSDRDFAIEICASCAIMMMHLSRFAEEIVLWMTQQFQFIEISDAYCTGSSIMPQKKNPDGAELIRGKTGRVYGSLIALLTIMKGQVLAYNRDNQEDKEPLFDALKTSALCLQIMAGMVSAMQVNREKMATVAEDGYTTATDVADYLVEKGIAFRDAHTLCGKIVQIALKEKCVLSELKLDKLQMICPEIGQDIYTVLDPAKAIQRRISYGGTAPQQVKQQVFKAREYLRALHTG